MTTWNWRSMLLVLSLACPLALGCGGEESEEGGPGADAAGGNGDNGDDGENGDDEKTFTITVPGDMSVQQGQNEEATVSIDRGDEFGEMVTISFVAPAGITVEPAEIEAKADQSEVTTLVSVAEDAKLGEVEITVKGTPETGKEVSEKFMLTVEKPEGEE